LQAALARFAFDPACAGLRDRLGLEAFAPVALDNYSVMLRWDAEAHSAGYGQPG